MVSQTTARGRATRPRTLGQWQEAADVALFFLKVADFQDLGLLTGGPVVNRRECERILSSAEKRGVLPHESRPAGEGAGE